MVHVGHFQQYQQHQQRNQQKLHEAGHMNVGWIRHDAPRERLVNYQHEKYAASRISITKEKEKEAKKKAADTAFLFK